MFAPLQYVVPCIGGFGLCNVQICTIPVLQCIESFLLLFQYVVPLVQKVLPRCIARISPGNTQNVLNCISTV